MSRAFWESQYDAAHSVGETVGWKRANFTPEQKIVISEKVRGCKTFKILLELLRSDLAFAECNESGETITGREVADYLEQRVFNSPKTLLEIQKLTSHIGLGIASKITLLALTEHRITDPGQLNDIGDAELLSSLPKNNSTSPADKTTLRYAFPFQDYKFPKRPSLLQVGNTAEPTDLDHWDTLAQPSTENILLEHTLADLTKELEAAFHELEQNTDRLVTELQKADERYIQSHSSVSGETQVAQKDLTQKITIATQKLLDIENIVAQLNKLSPETEVLFPEEYDVLFDAIESAQNALGLSLAPSSPNNSRDTLNTMPTPPEKNVTSAQKLEAALAPENAGVEFFPAHVKNKSLGELRNILGKREETLRTPKKGEVRHQQQEILALQKLIAEKTAGKSEKPKPELSEEVTLATTASPEEQKGQPANYVRDLEADLQEGGTSPRRPIDFASKPFIIDAAQALGKKITGTFGQGIQRIEEEVKVDREKIDFSILPPLKGTSLNLDVTPRKIPTSIPVAPEAFNVKIDGVNKALQKCESGIQKETQVIASLETTLKTLTNSLNAETFISDQEKKLSLEGLSGILETHKNNLKTLSGELDALKNQKTQLEQAQAEAAKNAEDALKNDQDIIENALPEAVEKQEYIDPKIDKNIASQTTLASLGELLIQDEYKNTTFGLGGRTIQGAEIAQRISEKIINAPVGTQIDPYLFIPDRYIASKVHELLLSSTEWVERDSKYGTREFEKVNITPLPSDAKKALAQTQASIAKAANPGMWTRVKNWVRTDMRGEDVRTRGGRAPFWAALSGILALSTLTNADADRPQTQQLQTPTVASAPSQNVAQEIPKTITTPATKATSVAPNQSEDALKEEAKTSTTQTATPFQLVRPDSLAYAPKATPNTEENKDKTSDGGEYEATSTTVAATESSNEEVSVKDLDFTVDTDAAPEANPEDETFDASPDPTEGTYTADVEKKEVKSVPEKSVVTVELPKNPTMDDFRNHFYAKGMLASFERLLSYAEGQEEKTRNGMPNSRAYWFETILFQNPNDIFRTKTSREMPASELLYALKRYRQQETGFSDSEINYIQIPELRAKQKAITDWHQTYIVPLNAKLKEMGSTSEVLENKNATMAEYLTDVIHRAQENGLGSPESLGLKVLTPEQVEKVKNYTPSSTKNNLSERNEQSGESSQEKSPLEIFSALTSSPRTSWLKDTLSGATLRGLRSGSLEDINDWLLYRFNPVIKTYWEEKNKLPALRVNQSNVYESGNYDTVDLEYMIAGFNVLQMHLNDLLRPGTTNSFPGYESSSGQIKTILADLQKQLAQLQG